MSENVYVREDGTEMCVITKELWGRIAASIIADGEKPSKAFHAIEKYLPLELTRAELEELKLRILMAMDPAERREMLRDYDTCPCCERWMGHNRPPADDSNQRQGRFDFDRRH